MGSEFRKLLLRNDVDGSSGVTVRNWMAHIKQERDVILNSRTYPSDVCKASMMFRPSAQCRDFDRVGQVVRIPLKCVMPSLL